MLSINTNTNFSDKSKSDDTASNEESSSTENLFATMFATIEDPEKKIIAEDDVTDELNITGLINQLDKDNPNNSLELKHQKGTKTGPKPELDVFRDFEKYKTFPNETGKEEKKYTLKFNLIRETLSDNISEELSISKANQIQSRNNSSKSFNNLVALENSKVGDIGNGNAVIEEELEEQLYKLKGYKNYESDAAKNQSVTLKMTKNSNEKDHSKSNLESYLSKNFVKQVSLSSHDSLKQNIPQERPILEEAVEANLKQGDSNNDLSALNGKQINTNRGTTQQPNILSNPGNIEAQLKMLEKNWGSNLAKIVENALREGREKIDIQLEPQKLGRLSITLSMSNNQTSIIVSTENTAAALLLNGAEERLSQMFEASGLKLSNFHANANNSNNAQGQTKQKNDKNGKEKIEVLSETESPKINENATKEDDNNKRNINIIA